MKTSSPIRVALFALLSQLGCLNLNKEPPTSVDAAGPSPVRADADSPEGPSNQGGSGGRTGMDAATATTDGAASASDSSGGSTKDAEPDVPAPDAMAGIETAPPAASLLSATSDPADDWISTVKPRPKYADIKTTAVYLLGDSLRFEMELYSDVPNPWPLDGFYGWFVDTDLNDATGQHYNDIGSDFNVQLDYRAGRGWLGIIYPLLGNRQTFTTFTVSGSKVTLTVPVSAFGGAKTLRYVSIDQVEDGNGYADKAPDTGHVTVSLP